VIGAEMTNDLETYQIYVSKKNKNRVTRDAEKMTDLHISVPENLKNMLEMQSKKRNKSVSMLASYFIWSGYYAEKGEYVPYELRDTRK
jgi:hypothetical protein